MSNLDTYYQLINVLQYGEKEAMNSNELYNKLRPDCPLPEFQRKLRILAHEARLKGHQVISGPNGYYKALSNDEWNKYKAKRFSAIKDELQSIASCDKTSLQDLIKTVYSINVSDQNYNLNL